MTGRSTDAMSSKRSTNNSVASLDDQTSVIKAVSSKSGLLSECLSTDSSGKTDKSKGSKKRAAKAKEASDGGGPGNSRDPGADVTSGTRSAARVQGPSATVTRATSGESRSDEGDVTDAEGQRPLLDPQGAQGLQPGFYQPHMQPQPWMWPFGFNPYGNFGNFNCAELPQQEWVDDSSSAMSDNRQCQDHVMSDEDNSEGEVEEVGHLESPPKPLQAQAEFDLSKVQGSGKIVELLKEQLTRVKEGDKVAPKVEEGLALLLDKYLLESQFGTDMDKLAKQYPRIANVERMKVPRLDTEVYQVIDQRVRNLDQSFQTIQKGLLAALAAMSPVASLAFERAGDDPELDELGRNLLDSLSLVSHAHNALSGKRREILRPHLAPVYAKALTKGHDTSAEWLYGGDLLTTTRKCEAAKRIGDKILKRKPQPQNKQQMGQQKRFRGPRPQGQGMMKAFVPFQQGRFPAPQNTYQHYGYGYPQQSQSNFGGGFGGGYQKQNGGRPQQPRQQGFPKKGGYQK